LTFCLKILGSGGAIPAYGRNHSSQILTINGKHFLIDCGEATQHSLIEYGIKPGKIEAIFISHLHGDHYLGLMGLISSMHLQGRTKSLIIFAPRGLKDIILIQLKYSNSILNFDLKIEELDTSRRRKIYEGKSFTAESFPLKHRIPCCGFLFKEKPKLRRINKRLLPQDLSLQNIIRLKNGEDAMDDEGKVIYKNKNLTLPPRISRSYAYCSDTCYDEALLEVIHQVDLLYHESTFLEDRATKAKETFHSTAKEAATIAKKAKVKRLIIGHFSARYKDITPFETEAVEIFKETFLAIEGQDYCVEE